MALAVGNILSITDVQTLGGTLVLNVYHYRVDEVGTSVTYEDVINTFQGALVNEVVNIQHNSLAHTGVIVRNLSNGIDIAEETGSVSGLAGGQGLPDFVAAGFRLVRATAATRHGQKRIGGMSEAVAAGNTIEGTQVANIAAIEAAMLAPLEVDAGTDFDFILSPVIVGRFPQGHAQAGQLDLSTINDIQDVQFTGLTSQNTRKVGRGA